MENDQVMVIKTNEINNGKLDFTFLKMQNIEGSASIRHQGDRATTQSGAGKHLAVHAGLSSGQTATGEHCSESPTVKYPKKSAENQIYHGFGHPGE
jgi:hypothetical protein